MIPDILLPKTMRRRAFVAGGFAACPALATDIDVFVTASTTELTKVRRQLLNHLYDQLNEDIEFLMHEEEDRRVDSHERYPGSHGVFTILKVCKVLIGNTEFHVLVTDGSIDEVLSSFDISTCQVAITSDGHVVRGDNWTPPSVPPVKLKDTPTTDARMQKYQERFGFPVGALHATS